MWLREVKKKAGGFAYVRFISRRYLRLAPMLVVGILSQLLAGHLFGHLPDKLDAVRGCSCSNQGGVCLDVCSTRRWWQWPVSCAC